MNESLDTLTVNEAAAHSGITRWAVWKAIKLGRVSAQKRGRDWHIARAEWERYRASLTQQRNIDSGIDSSDEQSDATDRGGAGHQDAE